MARTPSRPPRSERAQPSPYARPAGQVESQSSQFNQAGALRRSSSLASSLSGFGRSLFSSFRSNPGPVLPSTSRDLGNSEDGSEEEAWNGEPPQARRGMTPPSPEIVVAEIRRSGHPVPVMQLARSLSGGSPPDAVPGPSRRQQAQLALRQRSDQLDASQPDYGLGNGLPITPTPTFPGSFATQQGLAGVARAVNPAESSARALVNGSSSATAHAAHPASTSPFARLTKSISRIISPPSVNISGTPSNKRSRETTTPSHPPPSTAAPRTVFQQPTSTSPGFASFLPVAQTAPSVQVSRTRAEDSHVAADALKAYQAYMKAKPVEQLDAEDYRMITMLSQKAAQEMEQNSTTQSTSGTPARPITSTPSRPAALGTWAANTFEGTPRLIRPLPSNPGTPGTVFSAPASPSFGAATPGSAVGTPRGQKVYLGPGMSSRRLNASTSRSNLSISTTPFNPNDPSNEDEVDPKRRRTDSPNAPSQSSRSGPLNRSTSSVPPVPAIPADARQSAAALGRQSASNIMAGLIDDIAPELARPMVIVNPYDRPVPPRGEPSDANSQSSAPGTPSVRAIATPAKSALRKGKAAAQAESTPSRGAAARIAQTPNKTPLTTLELLQGKMPSGQNATDGQSGTQNGANAATNGRTSSGRHVRIETPERERDDNEVDDALAELDTPSKTTNTGAAAKPFGFGGSSASTAPAAFVFGASGSSTAFGSAIGQQPPAKQPEAAKKATEEPKKTEPLHAPTFSGFSSFGTPSKSSSGFGSSEPTSSFNAFVPVVQPASPAFKPTAVKAPAQPDVVQAAAPFASVKSAGSNTTAAPKQVKQDEKMTAKDLAKKVDEAALPFFTYNIPAAASSTFSPSEMVKSKAAAATLPSFSFGINATTGPTTSASSSASAQAPAPPFSGGFNWAAAGGTAPTQNSTDWTCSECALKSPATAQKCIACETPRPNSASAPTAASVPASAPAPAPASTGFNWAAAGTAPPPQASGWKCSVCMCQNGDDESQCVVCEAPK